MEVTKNEFKLGLFMCGMETQISIQLTSYYLLIILYVT